MKLSNDQKEIEINISLILKNKRFSTQIKFNRLSNLLRISSSFFAILGGVILASNTSISGYGFLSLGASSSQLVLSSLKDSDLVMLIYSLSLFLFVDCMGIYRWLLS